MRATLEQLKAMSSDEIHRSWGMSEFPFDGAVACGHCVTSHQVMNACKVSDHKDFRAVAREFWNKANNGKHNGVGETLVANIEEFFALRLFWDSLYPPSEETPNRAEALAKDVTNTEVVT